jgi:hypothetical protein
LLLTYCFCFFLFPVVTSLLLSMAADLLHPIVSSFLLSKVTFLLLYYYFPPVTYSCFPLVTYTYYPPGAYRCFPPVSYTYWTTLLLPVVASLLISILNILLLPLSRSPQPQSEKLVCKSQLHSMVVIGLQKPYAKTKVVKSYMSMMFIDSVDGCFYRDQNNTEQ